MATRSFFTRVFGSVLALALLVHWGSTPGFAQQQAKMLYLVKGVASEAGAPTTPQQAVELLDGQVIPSMEALAQHQADGKILAGGIVVGARAGVWIMEASSHEEVTNLVRNLPFWGILEWEVTPLETFAHRATLEQQQVEMLKKKALMK